MQIFSKRNKPKIVDLPDELRKIEELKDEYVFCNRIVSSHTSGDEKDFGSLNEPQSEYEPEPLMTEDICSYANDLSKSFNEQLFEYIDKTGKKDSKIYKAALIDRKHFSKIRSSDDYHPSFRTVTMLALALQLNIDEYLILLKSAAYNLPDNRKEYKVLRYCFENKIYDIETVNNYIYTVSRKSLNDI